MPQDGTVGHLQSFCWSISPTSQKMAKQGSISRAVKLVAMMWELYGIITILQYENGVRILKT